MPATYALVHPSNLVIAWLTLLAILLQITSAAECTGTKPCPSGCCSKYGFCGFTSEYCGAGCLSTCNAVPGVSKAPAGGGGEDDTFDRPSCDIASHRIERVIGYYELWSVDRPCNTMTPEAIPAGYYTHINVAYARVDPQTFEIRGLASGDDGLWKRIQSLRLEQPGVEIWIALGGRVFNDPGQPTRTTFSDIARSEESQKAFARSLLSMMMKYGFDGVDIDWEYPMAEEDYKNFPRWMKNLRSLLHSSGKKYGISLTLPASYSYLQHFDVKKLEDSVDWFNVKAYDMHGTWAKGDASVGPFINAHTNLTEIKHSMDLLWRNGIDPDKVVMGMAYYGRSFTIADPDCTEPGCVYRSGGAAGECSETVGVLLNSEVQKKIDKLGLTPTLYENDAVKAAAFGDQWVSFDEETFKVRGDYARSQCMGGVMVWAISHDDRKYTSAKALTSGIGRKRMDFPNYPETPPTPPSSSTQKRQDAKAPGGPACSRLTCAEKLQEVVNACRWSNCGEDCPSGWKWIDHEASDLKMTDETACGGLNPRRFCCPGDSDLPKCQWRGMPARGGKCSPGCNSGEVEVGTRSELCDFKHQSACCTSTKSTEPYGKCKWIGGYPTYARSEEDASCPSDYLTFLFSSTASAGGEQTQGYKSFCCKDDIPWQFQKCKWHQKATSRIDASWYCESSCPNGQIKLGMQHGDCAFGWEAYCCTGNPPVVEDDDGVTIERRDPDHQSYYEYAYLIDSYMSDPGAPDGYRSSG
ncbi:glycoside hydrolase superfamily [Aspergillus unguis]